MLIACPKCHRQYDAGSHRPGERVRCVCGAGIEVPEPRAGDVRMLHCSACGAALKAGSTDCEWCGASVGLGTKGLGDVCPECMTRLVAGAKFCSGCGIEIHPESVMHALTDLDCPRCKARLSESVATGSRMIECTSCGGLWLDEATFERITKERESNASMPLPGGVARTERPLAATPTPSSVAYLACPVCGQRMNRKNFANRSGVVLDWCRGHGWWFDADELERIVAFIDQGGLARARKLEAEASERRERAAAALRNQRMASVHAEFRRPGRGAAARGAGGVDFVGSLVDFLADLLR